MLTVEPTILANPVGPSDICSNSSLRQIRYANFTLSSPSVPTAGPITFSYTAVASNGGLTSGFSRSAISTYLSNPTTITRQPCQSFHQARRRLRMLSLRLQTVHEVARVAQDHRFAITVVTVEPETKAYCFAGNSDSLRRRSLKHCVEQHHYANSGYHSI